MIYSHPAHTRNMPPAITSPNMSGSTTVAAVLPCPSRAWEPSDCVRCDLSAKSDVLLISFAGNAADILGTTMFEFVKLTEDIPVKKVYLRDPENLWFQKGIPGVGDSVDAICRFLSNLRDDNNIRRVVVIGNSAGGYAAILFGILMGADEIHAFSPQTRLIESADSATPYRVEQLQKLQIPQALYLDLRNLTLGKPQPKTSVFVHYDPKKARDNGHARYMADVSGFHLVSHPVGGHAVASVLKQTGALKRLLQEALQGYSTISKAQVLYNELRVYPNWLGRSLTRRVQNAYRFSASSLKLRAQRSAVSS